MGEEQVIPLTAFSYIANRNSKEVHNPHCVWVSKIRAHNILGCISSEAAELIRRGGYNGCYHCLRTCDTDVGPSEGQQDYLKSDSEHGDLVQNLLMWLRLSEAKPDGWLEVTSRGMDTYRGGARAGDQIEISYRSKCQALSIDLINWGINPETGVARRIASEIPIIGGRGSFKWTIDGDLPARETYDIRVIGHWSGQMIELLHLQGGFYLYPEPEPPQLPKIEPLPWTSDANVQGLMWEKRPDGNYFDISKPTIIWVHGWSDSIMPRYYTRFLYKDEFLALGFNVGIFRYQKDIIDCLFARWQDWEVPTNTDLGVSRRCLNVTEPLSREYVVNAVWKTLGAGNKFRMALNEFFEPVALNGYNEEILLLAHSTGAQVATLGLSDMRASGHFKNDQKFWLVFLDPWVPPKAYVLYPGVCAEWLVPISNEYYSPYEAAKILSYLSKSPNGKFICCLSTWIPGSSSETVLRTHLSWVFDKATFMNDTNRLDLSEGCKYARMWDETYWGSVRLNVGFTEGRIHFHAIDFFCSQLVAVMQNMVEKGASL